MARSAFAFALLVGRSFAKPLPQNDFPGFNTTTFWNTTTAPPTLSLPPSTTADLSTTESDSGVITTTAVPPVFTATVTTTPDGFSTESMTGFPSNTIIHTTGPDGQPTDVPVIHDDDDDNDIGIILWGLIPIVGVLFDLPIAGIPDVYFPCPGCIPITPPDTDGPDDPDDPDHSNTAENPSSDAPTTTSAPTSSSASSSSSSSSSSSICTGYNDEEDPWDTMASDHYDPPTIIFSSMSSAPVTTTSDIASTTSDVASPSMSITTSSDSLVTSSPTASGFISGSVVYGPTSLCVGLSPGGGEGCETISAGCWATQPGWNFMPPITCSGDSTTTPTLTPTPTSTPTPEPTSTSPPPEPTRPTNLNCYSGKVTSPYRVFVEGDIQSAISSFCAEYINTYPATEEKAIPLDGKSWLDSTYLGEFEAVHRCDDPDPNWNNDLEKECVFAIGAIVYDCDWGSGDKWGGTGDWKCMSYKVNGLDSGDRSTGWDGN